MILKEGVTGRAGVLMSNIKVCTDQVYILHNISPRYQLWFRNGKNYSKESTHHQHVWAIEFWLLRPSSFAGFSTKIMTKMMMVLSDWVVQLQLEQRSGELDVCRVEQNLRDLGAKTTWSGGSSSYIHQIQKRVGGWPVSGWSREILFGRFTGQDSND